MIYGVVTANWYKVAIPLVSSDEREHFFLDINRRSRNELKVTHQNRARRTEVLLRLCAGGPPHRNPDGTEVESPHIHVYREGYGDKWACSVPSSRFPVNASDMGSMLFWLHSGLQHSGTTQYTNGVLRMIEEVTRLLDEYQSWLRSKTRLRQIQDWVEITTPYLDRHNDYLQICAIRSDESDGFVLSDDGYILSDLELSGCKVDTPKRRELLRTTLNGFGVQLNRDSDAIEVYTSSHNFWSQKAQSHTGHACC